MARNYGTIQNAYNSGEISVDNAEDMGGIAGRNNGTIASVFNSGNLTGICGGENYMGGIAGFQYGTITDAYNSGAITNERGDGYTGGIVGSNRGTVNRTYNLGTLTGGANLGGIAWGGWSWTSVENSYYLDTIEPAGAGSSKGTAKSADELRQAETFASWGSDISAVGSKNATWRIYDGNSNPLLTAFMTAKDNYQGTSVYNGEETGDVGANYRDSTYSGTAEQIGGINYVNDYTIVTPKALTVTNVNKTYDGTDTATIKAANLSGVVTGDTLTVSTTSANYADKNAATGKTVTYVGLILSGAKAKNYTIDASGTTTGNISPKEITATFADIAKTYDGTTNATAGQGTLAGVVAGDTGKVSVSGLAAYDTKHAGDSKTVNYTGVTLSGEEAANYTIATTATGSGIISKADVTISVENYSRAYDGTTDATGATLKTVSGQLFAGDSMSGGTKTFTGGEDVKNVGTGKTIAVSGVTINDGNGGNNYNVTYQTGTGEITRRALSLVADPVSITEGAATPTAFGGKRHGLYHSGEVRPARAHADTERTERRQRQYHAYESNHADRADTDCTKRQHRQHNAELRRQYLRDRREHPGSVGGSGACDCGGRDRNGNHRRRGHGRGDGRNKPYCR